MITSFIDLVHELQNKTGASLMDCKYALDATGKELSSAFEWMRMRGLLKNPSAPNPFSVQKPEPAPAKPRHEKPNFLNTANTIKLSMQSHRSSGNKDLDELIYLRAVMSCLFGYVKAKSDNIKKNTSNVNIIDKQYKDNGNKIKNCVFRIGEISTHSANINGQLLRLKYEYEHASIFNRSKKKKEYEDYILVANYNFAHDQEMIVAKDREKETIVNENNQLIQRMNDINLWIEEDYDDIKTVCRDFESLSFCIAPTDYDYVDYLIYLFESHRAISLREALQQLDNAIRHNELMNALNQLSVQINQSLNRISNQIAYMAASINTNLGYINSSLQTMNSSINSLEGAVIGSADRIEARQLETQSLIKEGNRIASLNYEATKKATSSLEGIRTRMFY